jgi:hypothetical protein
LIKPNQAEWERLYEKNGFVFYKRASR